MSAKSAPKPNPARESKLRYIGQAHVLRGLSLAHWHEIVLQKHHLSPRDDWHNVPEATLDAIITDIQALTNSVPLPLRGVRGGPQ